MKQFTLLFFCSIGWSQIKITPPDISGLRAFGLSADMYQNQVIVGHNNVLTNLNAVSFHTLQNGASTIDATFTSQGTVGDGFGERVKIDGEIAVVAASADDEAGTNAGAVYLFKKSNGIWNLSEKIMAPNPAANDHFGEGIALYGTTLFVGAPNHDGESTDSGCVYVFNVSGNAVLESTILQPGSSKFGEKLAADNQSLAVLSTPASMNCQTYVYYKESDWQLKQTIPAFGDASVIDFDFDGDKFYHLRQGDITSNIVSIYQWMGSTLSFEQDLSISHQDYILGSIAVKGNRMFLGATYYVLLMSRNWSLAYYSYINDAWQFQDTFSGFGTQGMDDSFGQTVLLSDNYWVATAPSETINFFLEGAVYFDEVPNLSTDNYEANSVSIYPNPATETIFIAPTIPILTAEIVDMQGRIIMQSSENTIPVSGFQPGIYFVRMTLTDQTTFTKSFIKK